MTNSTDTNGNGAAATEDRLIHWEDQNWTVIQPAGIKLALMSVKGGSLKGEPAIALIEYPPDFYWPEHQHDVPHIEIVVSGTQLVGGREERAGTVRWVPGNFTYGPLQMGPEGARIIEVFPDGDLPAVFGTLTDVGEIESLLGLDMNSLLGQLGALVQ